MAWIVLTVLAVVVLGVLILLVVAHNRLVRQRNLVQDAWAGIDVQLTRRADLVPNLVEVVQAYATHERETLEDVSRARSETVDATEPRTATAAADHLEGSLNRLVAVAEAYPDLKANDNFLDLQRQLGEIEEDISFARRYYNAHARKYNDLQQTFPTLLVAGAFGHERADYFQADAEARAGVSTEFGD